MVCKVLVASVLLVFGAAVAAAQQPPIPCCAPDQFTFHYVQVFSSQKGDLPMLIYRELVDGAYDFINAVVGLETYINQVNGTELKVKLIQNYTDGFQWVIEGNVCTKMTIPVGTEPQRCVPAGATFEGTYYVGLEKVKVHTWLIDVSTPGVVKGQQYYTVTDYMCTPLSSNFVGTDLATVPPTVFSASGNYVNFNTTIVDRDRWFKLPDSCKQARLVSPLHPTHKILRTPRMHFF